MAGSTHRVGEMMEVLTEYCDTPDIVTEDSDEEDDSTYLLRMEGVDIVTPKSDVPIIRNLNLTVEPSSNLLIMGPSGAGKTSIFRVISSLWPTISGSLKHIRERNILYFPQQPYFSEGSLREQVTQSVEPADHTKDTDKILSLLKMTNLSNLVERCGGLDMDPCWNWSQVLSPGETQRLVWTRLLYRKPRLALLDEATSAISEAQQELLYQACAENNITVVSIGHRESVRRFHNSLLLLDSTGAWRFITT